METMLIRFVEADGGHRGLINRSDFDPSRHIPVDEDGNPLEPAGTLDVTPGGISTVNMGEAKDLIAKAATVEALDALDADERASAKNDGGRKGVLKAIADRRAELDE